MMKRTSTKTKRTYVQSLKQVVQAAKQLKTKKGIYYRKWREGMIRLGRRLEKEPDEKMEKE